MNHLFRQSLYHKLDQLTASQYDTAGAYALFDTAGRALVANEGMLKTIGISNISDLIGKKTSETPWACYEKQFNRHNNVIYKKDSAAQFFEFVHNTDGEMLFFISHKEPFYHLGRLIGIQVRSMQIPYNERYYARPFSDRTIFIDTRSNKLLHVSKQRRETLYLMLKGLNNREIAEKRNLSARTIEHHINYIRSDNNYANNRELLIRVQIF